MALIRAAPRENNKLRIGDKAAHDWYRFVLSFPPHLVRDCLDTFAVKQGDVVLDPFCGTGTTLVECKKRSIESIGIEANPLPRFASEVKVDWSVDPALLYEHANRVAARALAQFQAEGLPETSPTPTDMARFATDRFQSLPKEQADLLLENSISPLPLHRTLVLLECIEHYRDDRVAGPERLALAKALISGISNLEFGPEVGVGELRSDAPVVAIWLARVEGMVRDLQSLRLFRETSAHVYQGDARRPTVLLPEQSVDIVVTSPPYPNEKDYTRTTRLESVVLGLLHDRPDLRAVKRTLVKSNTRGVYKSDTDDGEIAEGSVVGELAHAIESRRIELGKTSGFERLYPRVTKLYFGGMKRHLADLRGVLRPGARLAYVVGDQASYLRVMIHTGQLLADIARDLGYEVLDIRLFRTRLATATRAQLREEILMLRWRGN